MRLLRVGIGCKENLARIAVLCPGCLSDFLDKVPKQTHHWTRDYSGDGECEFCSAEVRRAARAE